MWATVGFCCGARIDSVSFMSPAQNLAQTINYMCPEQFLPSLNLENVSENHHRSIYVENIVDSLLCLIEVVYFLFFFLKFEKLMRNRHTVHLGLKIH